MEADKYITLNHNRKLIRCKLIKYIVVLLCLFVYMPIYCQQYTFRNLTMREGLSDLLVNAFYKDSVGFVWIGTANCLDRFDGVNIKHYPFSGGDANKKRVNAIIETKNQQLWTGNGYGLWKLNKEKDVLERVFPEAIDCSVQSFATNKTGELYIGTNHGLFVLSSNKVKQIRLEKNLFSSANNIVGIDVDASGIVWMATLYGISSYNPVNKKINHYHFEKVNPDLNQFSGLTRIKTTLYLGTSNAGVIRFDTKTHTFSKFVDVGSNIISDISSDGKDLIYVATDGNGVHFISHKGNKIVRSIQYSPKEKDGIRSNSIYSLLVDREGIIWIGFYQAGLDYSLYQNNLFSVYSYENSFSSLNLPVRSFVIHGDEKLIGTREGLFFISEKSGLVRSFRKGDSALRSNLILSLRRYDNKYLIGTYGGGISVLDPISLQITDFNSQVLFQNKHIFHFEEDKNGNLWIAASDGVYCYNKQTKQIKIFTNSNSQLPEGNVYFIFFDSLNNGWIATDNGLCIFDPASQSIKSNVFPNGFINREKVRYIYEDSKHKLYFCPDKGPIFISDLGMNKFNWLKTDNTLLGNTFVSVIEDNFGNYWASRDYNMTSYKSDGSVYYNFSSCDGIPDPVFNVAASYKDEKGILWFGNAKGLLSVNPKLVSSLKKNPYAIVFTDFVINGRQVDPEKQYEIRNNKYITLQRRENNIVFRFVNLSYSNPESLVYEYKLDGLDQEWHTLAGQNEVSYYELPRGKYTFRVRLQQNPGSEQTIGLEVLPLFPMYVWILIAIVVVTLIFGGRNYFRKFYYKINNAGSMEDTQKRSVVMNAKNVLQHLSDESILKKSDEEKYKFAKLSDEESKHICENLIKYMKAGKPYINPDLKISDLAQAINCSSHSLSYVFNQYLKQNYYDFVNEYRVAEFKSLANDAKYSKYTLSALAEKCGFSSRASFFRSFKKQTGITPNEYIQQLESSK